MKTLRALSVSARAYQQTRRKILGRRPSDGLRNGGKPFLRISPHTRKTAAVSRCITASPAHLAIFRKNKILIAVYSKSMPEPGKIGLTKIPCLHILAFGFLEGYMRLSGVGSSSDIRCHTAQAIMEKAGVVRLKMEGTGGMAEPVPLQGKTHVFCMELRTWPLPSTM